MGKVVRQSVARAAVEELHLQNKKVVFTNGCFDVLHAGHVRYLQEARALGDCLVIGLNTDESIRSIKGPDRPFIPEFERAEMLAALACVDFVVLYGDATAVKLVELLKPDIYAKGGDTNLAQSPEAPIVRSYGGEIVLLSNMEGKSTSRLVSQIRSSADAPAGGKKRNVVLGIIPARMASTRLPNKPVLDICGKSMIQWVYENARRVSLIDRVIVATPDEEIRKCVEKFGGEAAMTSSKHRSGTDRLAEVARRTQADIIVNIQGDEPLLDPGAVEMLVRAMVDSPDIPMGSLMCPISDAHEEDDPAVVKVVTDRNNLALYFSRSRIPYPREASTAMKHIGIYAYRYHFLIAFASLEPTPLEKAESLEQLRALENGFKIKMVETDCSPVSVDTPEDLEKVRQILADRGARE